MTKQVRIENADSSSYAVVVEEWDGDPNGASTFVKKTLLRNPTEMRTTHIWNTRWIIVREATAEDLQLTV